MGKSTISMAIFNSYVSLPEGTNQGCFHQLLSGMILQAASSTAGPTSRFQYLHTGAGTCSKHDLCAEDQYVNISHDGSMVLVYMLTWLGYIDGKC